MSPSLRTQATSIVLIALAIAVATYAWFLDRGKVSDAERTARAASVLPAFRRADITRIEIARAAIGGRAAETIVLERDGEDAGATWQMTSPRREPANVAAIEGLLHELESATRVRKVDGPAGIDAPRVRATIAMGAVTWRLALGGAALRPEGAAYLKVDGEPAIVVRRELADRLLATADAYRDRTISPYASSEIGKLVVRGAASLAVERGSAGDFVVVGDGTRASQAALQKVWSALGEMRAEAFLDDAEGERLVASPAFTIEMTPREPSRARGEIVVGGACPGHESEDVVVVRRAPAPVVAACAPKAIVDGLSVAKDALLDRRIFAASADEVTELRLRDLPMQTLDLARAGNGWHEREPIDRTLAADEVEAANALVLALTRAEGTLLDRAEWDKKPRGGFPSPSHDTPTARLTRAERGEDEIAVRARDASGVVVQRLSDGAYLRIDAATARLLEPRGVAVRGRDLWGGVEAPEIRAVSTRCGVAQDVTHDAAWKMTAPAGYPVDVAGALDVANAIVRAKPETWIADADDGSFGFADAKCSVAVTIVDDGGTRRLGLVLGGDADGGVHAHVEGAPQVFVVARAVRDAARRLLVDRNAVSIDLAQASRVLLVKKGARVEIAVGAGRVRDGGNSEEALASLRATAVLHVGAAARDEGFDAPTLEVRVSSGDAGARRVVIGASTTLGNEKLFFARADGVDATFAVPKASVDAILAAF